MKYTLQITPFGDEYFFEVNFTKDDIRYSALGKCISIEDGKIKAENFYVNNAFSTYKSTTCEHGYIGKCPSCDATTGKTID